MFTPLVIIPARKGSKGVPGKNTKSLAGKPLIAYTFESALEVFDPGQICVTTDDEKVVEIAKSFSIPVPFARPPELAQDGTSMTDVIQHALLNFPRSSSEYDAIVLLQPTSPFRTAAHIKEAIRLFDYHYDMIVSVKETTSNPYYVLFEEDELGYLQKSKEGNFKTRQECPKVWEYNGAIYIINVKSFSEQGLHGLRKIKKYVMNEMDSIDIDTSYDWVVAETVLKGHQRY